jgi:hypothetical protein
LHEADNPAPIVPLFRQRSLDPQKPVDTADLALGDVAAARHGHSVSHWPPRIRESRSECCLNYVVAYAADKAGPHGSVVGEIHGIKECDFTDRNAVCQLEAAQSQNFELPRRAFLNEHCRHCRTRSHQ